MDLAFVDKLACLNNSVKYLLNAVDISSTFVRIQIMKTKCAKYSLLALKKMISRKNTPEKPEKFWNDKGTEHGGILKNFARRKTLKFTQQ